MTMEQIFTGIIPAILIFFLVFFNIRKMQKQAKIMKMEQEYLFYKVGYKWQQ